MTHNSDSPHDPSPITPNHFLLNHDPEVFPADVTCNADELSRKRWRRSQFLADQLWRLWRREYLPLLTLRHKWTTENKNIAVGDVVMIVDDSLPRALWPLARVHKVHPGKDGRVRSVTVKTRNKFLDRPVTKLCILEQGQ